MEEKLKNCGSHRYAHQTVESTNCRADLIHVSNSEIYRSQGVVDLDFLETKGGIHETTKTLGSASTVKSTGQYSGLDLR